jgi:hypothetical protein
VGAFYDRVEYTTGTLLHYDHWVASAQLNQYFTQSLLGQLTYQYQNRASSLANDSFYENVVFLSLTKYFY